MYETVYWIEHVLRSIFPERRVRQIAPLAGGLRNTNLKVTFGSGEAPVVLRIYRGDAEVCRKETAVLRLVRPTVPVPDVLHSEPLGLDGSPPFVILEFIDGVNFRELKRSQQLSAIQQAATSIGQILATIGRFQFDKPGRLLGTTDGIAVGAPYVAGPDPIPTILDTFLDSTTLHQRLDGFVLKQLHDFIWSWAPLLPDLSSERHLVHSDFGNRNTLLHEVGGRWAVAAVLDWEFAFSGSQLLDVGNFLRYENDAAPLREPFFSRAYVENGGVLPDNWRKISRVIDVTALVECLTHEYLPDDVVSEILGLISETLRECHPDNI
jgi:aminoglycoside phosphotransferase (APT) family kinase protein